MKNLLQGKYSMLTLYRYIYFMAGWLTIVAFVTFGIVEMRYSFFNLFAGIIAGLIIGGGIIVISEMITLFICMEDHLDRLCSLEENKTSST